MVLTRRALAKWTGGTGIALLLGSWFPEVAAARPVDTRAASARGAAVIALTKRAERTADVLARYPGYTFRWDDAIAVLDASVARVTLVGTSASKGTGAVIVSAFVDLSASKVMFVQHTSVVRARSTGEQESKVRIAFDAGQPVWRGVVTPSGDLVPEARYPDVQTLKSMKQPNSCRSLVGKVCSYAAEGDSILACAVLVETGPGAIACGVALFIISHYGCKKLQSMICS